ncbi:MAG: AAA family ATPase [Deltaproteobacteria bacterium]
MKLSALQHDHDYCLQKGAELLKCPVRAVSLEWEVEQLLRKHLRLETRQGWSSEHPFLAFTNGPKGQRLEFGLERYGLEIEGTPVPLARVVAPSPNHFLWKWYQFWAVPVEHHRRLYRFLRRIERSSFDVIVPIMRDGDRRRLWNQTIGFLTRGRQELRKYGVPQKRGILLLGTPGNGKTMACRWLLSLCHQRGLRWRSVAAEELAGAREMGSVRELFELDGPGIILFDDLDQALREGDGNPADRSTFLTELDGLHPREGVVYLFTSNARVGELDPAFRRPGRIDLFVQFPRPDAELRRRFVAERWHADIAGAIDLDDVVRATEGLSFAEMDEVKKLLVLRFLETGAWDWEAAWSAYRDGHGVGKTTQRIGFHSPPLRGRSGRELTITANSAS